MILHKGQLSTQELTTEAYLPPNPEDFTYDDDGNLTSDSRWSYTWNGENRLVEQDTLVSAVTNAEVPDYRVTYRYDSQGRMFERKVYLNEVLQSTEITLWDGYNQLAKLDGSGNLLQAYTWGLDLSGTFQGAGGVGGLLAITDDLGSTTDTYYPAYDGNGNVISYIDSLTGTLAAQYEYGPFGQTLRSTGPQADKLLYRFSTKPVDPITGMVLYELRPYSPELGRWPSRDLIGEDGGLNLYAFVGNDGVNQWDYLGMLLNPDYVIKEFSATDLGADQMILNMGYLPSGKRYADYFFGHTVRFTLKLRCIEPKDINIDQYITYAYYLGGSLYKSDSNVRDGNGYWNGSEPWDAGYSVRGHEPDWSKVSEDGEEINLAIFYDSPGMFAKKVIGGLSDFPITQDATFWVRVVEKQTDTILAEIEWTVDFTYTSYNHGSSILTQKRTY